MQASPAPAASSPDTRCPFSNPNASLVPLIPFSGLVVIKQINSSPPPSAQYAALAVAVPTAFVRDALLLGHDF